MSAALYARVSSEEQRDRQTIRTQTEFGERFAELRGLQFSEHFLDDGVTGTLPLEKRPGGAALLEAARAGRIKTVYVYRLDRIGRDIRVIHNAIHALEEAGCALVSMTESFETQTPSGKAMLGMLAVFAAFERDSIGERIRAGMDTAFREEGRWLGGHRPPYGYVVEERGEKKYLVPLETEAAVVRMMFELAAQGWSSVKIAEYLAALQIPTPNAGRPALHWKTGKPASGVWQSGSVLRILRNPTYHGIRKRTPRKAKWPEQACEPLVDEKTWQATQETLTRLRNPKTRPGEHTYILRGLLICGACGRKYHGWPQQRGYFYYMCHGWRYKPRCAGKLLSTTAAEREVWGRIEAWLAEEEAAAAALKGDAEAQQTQQAERDRERETLRQRIAAKSGERDRILGLYRRSIITDAELDRQLADIQKEQEMLTERWEALSVPVAREQVMQRAELAAQIRAGLQRDDSPESRQRVCEQMIEAIHVTTYPKRGAFRLEIIWRV